MENTLRGHSAPAQAQPLPTGHGFPLDVKQNHSTDTNTHHAGAASSKILAWLKWAFSVIVCSAVLSRLMASVSSWQTSHDFVDAAQDHMSLHYPRSAMTPVAPVVKRQSTCAASDGSIGDYDMPIRIGAVFIILVVSASACAFPVLAARLPGLKMPASFFFSVRHFGTGVLIATAFCHLLPTAFTLLHDPCLDSFWTETYPAMPGAIALGAVIFVTAIEMWMHPNDGHHHAPPADPAQPVTRQKGQFVGREQSIGRHLSYISTSEKPAGDRIASVLSDDPELAAYLRRDDPQSPTSFRSMKTIADNNDVNNMVSNDNVDLQTISREQKRKREISQCLLLEMGILFHSVFIGMALSVAMGGNQFIILLVAISFHQTFEGLALGSRIAAIDWPAEKAKQPWLMALAYGCTTPLGQVLGLATRSAYSPDSEVGLILVGVMNSISSGLLIFASLVELLSEDLLSDESWKILSGKQRVCAFLLVILGAFGMSLIGAWA
ncbi:solute carrier family 39 (zinc transporter) member 1/2/3 [Microdochium nivale]|nr:solute carrier family 39 (zinc transporter) member 1/2/3 [Microdochium nivale]